jgi:16S rRNA C967 or C1407 C5-methylase (RsmB/RsmF family)/NOL1/NOP2/fmu family ribosome biogenesis protein
MSGQRPGRTPTERGGGEAPSFPELFLSRVREQLGGEVDEFLHALAAPEQGLRLNAIRMEPDRFASIAPFEITPLQYPSSGFLVPPASHPARHPYHAAGVYYLQDPGSMVAGALLDPRPGERVLDLAAAPGGKTTHLAALMHNRGVLIANDPHPGRARELTGNLERCGVENAIVTTESVDRLASRLGPCFDRVLLDAPCSGEAMFHKSPAACSDWSPAGVRGAARRQIELLADAAALVRPAGRLVYSTCTFAPEENEVVVGEFLDRHPEFRAVRTAEIPGASPGVPEWAPHSARRSELANTIRLWPHRFPGAGHFIAPLERADAPDPTDARARSGNRGSPPAQAIQSWSGFQREVLSGHIAEARALELGGEWLSAVPDGAPTLHGLRVIRTGLLLGSMRKGRFAPAHALAMALRPGDAIREARFEPDDPAIAAFLRGETLASAGPEGWLLVSVDGFPLGWGKRVGAVVKNHYPKGLRVTRAAPSSDRGTRPRR